MVPIDSQPSADRVEGRGPGFGIRIRTLLAIVACSGAVFWSWRSVEESRPSHQLANSLREGSVIERQIAAQQLGNVELDEAVAAIGPLTAALGDPDFEVRTTAARSLGEIGVRATTAHRQGAELALAAKVLTQAVLDKAPEVRAEAAHGLFVMLFVLKEDPQFDTHAAADALGSALHEPIDNVRHQVRQALALLGEKGSVVPPRAVFTALERGETPLIRSDAALVLGRFRNGIDEAVDDLIRALKDRDARVRYRAAVALGEIGAAARNAIPALIETLKSPVATEASDPALYGRDVDVDSDPGCAAARSLGQIAAHGADADQVIQAFSDVLRGDNWSRHPAVAAGLVSLGERGSPATPALIPALRTMLSERPGTTGESWLVRALGAVAPEAKEAPEAVQVLVQALAAGTGGSRLWAAESLGQFGPTAVAAVSRLREAQTDTDRSVAQMAKAAIAKIEGRDTSAESHGR
jgi:HEAT repeat protein